MKGTDTHTVTFICSCSPCHHLSEVVPPSEEHVIKRSSRLDSHQVDMITCPHYFIFVFLCRCIVKSWMPSWKWWVITCTCCLFNKLWQVYSSYKDNQSVSFLLPKKLVALWHIAWPLIIMKYLFVRYLIHHADWYAVTFPFLLYL